MAGKLIESQLGLVVQVPPELPGGVTDYSDWAYGPDYGYGDLEDVTGFVADRSVTTEQSVGWYGHELGRHDSVFIYDHTIDGDLDVQVGRFAQVLRDADVSAVVLHPGLNEGTRPYMEALLQEGVEVVAAADMTAETRLLSAGAAWDRFFREAVELGVSDFKVPGDDTRHLGQWCAWLDEVRGVGGYTLYAACPRRGDLDLTLQTATNLQVIVPPGLTKLDRQEGATLPLSFGYAVVAISRDRTSARLTGRE